MRILGISLGTRDNGIALLIHGKLTHWQLHTFRGVWSDEKLAAILTRYDLHIVRHRITMVVIKVPPVTHQTVAFVTLLKKLIEQLHYRGCLVTCKTKREVKGIVPEIKNKESLMEYITIHYPILLPEQARERSSKRPYQIKMFEAVLAAHLRQTHIE